MELQLDYRNALNNCAQALTHCKFITARKRSFGQGNIFIGVCQGGVGGVCSGGVSAPRGEGVSAPGGGGSAPGWGGCLVESPLQRLLLRAVRILLECILVAFIIYQNKSLNKNTHACKIITEPEFVKQMQKKKKFLVSNKLDQKHFNEQECIPVGCVPAAH